MMQTTTCDKAAAAVKKQSIQKKSETKVGFQHTSCATAVVPPQSRELEGLRA